MTIKIPVEHNQLAYSVARTAKLLGMSRQCVYDEIAAGRLRSFIHGQRRRSISAEAINEWVLAREKGTDPTVRLRMPRGMRIRGSAMR